MRIKWHWCSTSVDYCYNYCCACAVLTRAEILIPTRIVNPCKSICLTTSFTIFPNLILSD